MKYKCLVFDHDDTVVNSTATLHYPSFLAYLKTARPGMGISLEEYFLKNFNPGYIQMCVEDFHMTGEELAEETEFWHEYVKGRIPKAYAGIAEIMRRHREQGGIICVISHSFKDNILRDYAANGLPEPDAVYGWEQPPERRKPSTWAVGDIMKRFSLEKKDLLMIDDLKPGFDMAAAAGIDFAGAGWAYDIPRIENFMRENCGL